MKNKKAPQKRRKFLGLLLILTLVLFLTRNYWIDAYYYFRYHSTENLHPSQTYVPRNYKIVGVDISRYQEKFLWERASIVNQFKDTLKVQFIIAKASEGSHLKDPMYDYHLSQSKKNEEIVFGAYHFFLPDQKVEPQVNHFVKVAKLKEGNILPVIDIEQTRGQSNKVIRKKLNLFCNLLENKYGKKPILYSNKDFLINNVGEGFKEYPIWVAHYGVEKIQMPEPWKWNIWQFTDQGSSFATKHPIDVNVFNGSRNDLKKLCIQ